MGALPVVERTDELAAQILRAGERPQRMRAEERRRRRVRAHEARRARAGLAVDDGVVDRDVVAAERHDHVPEAGSPNTRR